jgi:hypothetical protein
MARMRKPITLSLLALVLLGNLAAQAQDALVTKRQTTLRESPAEGAAAIATLPAQTALTRQPTRQGPWVQVKTATGASGWIHLFDVGNATEQGSVASAATGALRGLTNLFNRGSAPTLNTTSTATVGIRGLGAEDLANARPNMAELTQAEGMRQDAAQAKRFAVDANLRPQAVAPLPVPPPPAPVNATNTNNTP